MEAHKLLLSMILALALLVVPAYAIQFFPAPVYGRVINLGELSGYQVRMTNLFTGEVRTVTTDSTGWYQYEWANSAQGLLDGHNMRIELLGCDKPECTVTRIFKDYISQNFNITGKVPPVCKICEVCPVDTTPYAECNSCCETCPDTCDACDSCCPECPTDCPDPDENRAIEILLTALIAAGAAGSAVTLTLGKMAQHYHRGIKDKHSILTRHRDPLIRHPVGEVAPVYRVVDGKYQYIPKEKR